MPSWWFEVFYPLKSAFFFLPILEKNIYLIYSIYSYLCTQENKLKLKRNLTLLCISWLMIASNNFYLIFVQAILKQFWSFSGLMKNAKKILKAYKMEKRKGGGWARKFNNQVLCLIRHYVKSLQFVSELQKIYQIKSELILLANESHVNEVV